MELKTGPIIKPNAAKTDLNSRILLQKSLTIRTSDGRFDSKDEEATTYVARSTSTETLLVEDDRDRGRGVKVSFDPYGSDTVVYVHIQKTGGSEFLEHLVTAQIPIEVVHSKNTTTEQPARDPDTQLVPLCRTSKIGGWQRGANFIHHEMCPRDWMHPNGETWLVSEKTTGWNCGVHAFYRDFKRCLSNSTTFNRRLRARRNFGEGRTGFLSESNHFHYVGLLRHPILRYVSEYLHVLRGACWKREYVCDGGVMKDRQPPPFECPYHFNCDRKGVEGYLRNITLEKFAKCSEGWSTNRMTISLADHDEATCWNKTRYTREERDQILLESAKSNLLKFSYFGITDFPSESSELFEKTFGVVLRNPLKAMVPMNSRGGQFLQSLSLDKKILTLIVENNRLDLELYEYAIEIFKKRIRTIGRKLDTETLNYIDKLNLDMNF